MMITQDKIVGELVTENYKTATIFKNHGIDFCCKGNRTINEACEKSNTDIDALIKNLEHATTKQEDKNNDFKSWPLDMLADYIEKIHHRYVAEKSIEIKPYLDKVCAVHGGAHPELLEIRDLFGATIGELTQHMKKEELILFPFIRKMTIAKNERKTLETPPFGTINNPVQMMMDEHEIAGDRFRKISGLSNNYSPPDCACSTFRVVFALLKEFEEDLHLHIHLENNILFPTAIEVEKELNNA